MNNFLFLLLSLASTLVLSTIAYLAYLVFIEPALNPLRSLPGPPARGLLTHHMNLVMDPSKSPRTHDAFVKQYGRNIRIRGPLPWDQRLFTLDPVALAHVLKHSTVYEKPWQSRNIITGLIGCGMLATEGQVHKRQRRVATPAFSIQNMRALVPLVFSKGLQLKDKWKRIIAERQNLSSTSNQHEPTKLDVCHWVSRATFDVIGSAGFDYQFNAIENEGNELFTAYRDMFELAVSQHQQNAFKSILVVYFPIIDKIFPDERVKTVERCQGVIKRVAGQLIQEKKRKLMDSEKSGIAYQGTDLLSLLLKSNAAADLPPEQRISDEDILHNINTFMFAGSDTSSLSITWALYILAIFPAIQTRLREELVSALPIAPLESLTEDEIGSLYTIISELPYLDNVVKEVLRLIPPIHSSLRVAVQDDVVPTSSPMKFTKPDGTVVEETRSVRVPKGSFVHVPIEAFNLDKEVWGPDAWAFNPDRWESLPEAVASQPGLYSNILTFSAGPRSCIGLRFSIIEIKSFLFVLLTNFIFAKSEDVGKANVVLTRPYVVGKHKEGSQCPLFVTPYVPNPTS